MTRPVLADRIRTLLAGGERLTAPEIADRLDCHPTSATNCLSVMLRHGEVARTLYQPPYVYRRSA